MPTSQLFVRLYAGCVVALIAVGLLSLTLMDDGKPNALEGMKHLSPSIVSELAARRFDAQSFHGELNWLAQFPLRLSLYEPSGHLLGSSVFPPLPMIPREMAARLADESAVLLDKATAYAARENGQLVAIGIVRWEGRPFGRIAARLGGLLLGFLVFAALFARYLAKPLQHLADTAQRFGRGELHARARLDRDDEIGAVGRAFDEMADRVKLLIAAQQELMANVSHELQTPMARIHVALEHIAVKGVYKAKELLPEIELDLAELQRLFDDVMMVARLDLSRIHDHAVQTPLRIEKIALAPLLEKVARRFRAEHQTHNLVIDVEPELPEIAADSVLLRRVIDNLVENARKYSEPWSQIRVSAAANEPGVIIEVSDSGIGIDDSDLQYVFTPFFRSDRSRARQTGGVGLGLALARRVVEAHGGTIDLRSVAGSGTTVTLQLPAERESNIRKHGHNIVLKEAG